MRKGKMEKESKGRERDKRVEKKKCKKEWESMRENRIKKKE